jgi:CBS domain-containing protein
MSNKQGTGIKVGDVMTRNFISISPNANLMECAKKMIKKRVGSLILEENQKLYGLLTEHDILWAMTKKSKLDLHKIKAKDIAARKLNTIKPGADLQDALAKMKKHKFKRLPVVVKDKVIGLLTVKDILRIEPVLFDSAREIFQVKEESEKLKRKEAYKKDSSEKWTREGMCEECGNFDLLYKINGLMVCESCKDSM